jgi:hypothetical protein
MNKKLQHNTNECAAAKHKEGLHPDPGNQGGNAITTRWSHLLMSKKLQHNTNECAAAKHKEGLHLDPGNQSGISSTTRLSQEALSEFMLDGRSGRG